ncbi:MAG: hypothetical protein EOP87_15990 [Verrucomicrobiaceae bacterium]|nr:MAG: hypothetical protein EOP87_15990 [Verrucomicrobiaceae bacterium]
MIKKLVACSILVLSLPSLAQEARTVSARVVYFQEENENPTDLFFALAEGEYGKVSPASGVAGESARIPVDAGGQVSLLKSPGPGSPVAVAKVPADVEDVVFFLLKSPAPSTQGPSYKVLVADESAKNMPRGSSFVCNVGGFGARISLGETRYVMAPGKPAYVKRPDKRDEYNMAAFQMEAQDGAAWKPVKDTMIRFSENERYFFLIYAEAGGSPSVKIYKQFMPAGKNASGS